MEEKGAKAGHFFEQGAEKSTLSGGKLFSGDYPRLNDLSQPARLNLAPLTLNQLEMLEAELINQGLLPVSEERIAEAALRQIALFRWKARRFGANQAVIDYRIDLPRFILALATELAESNGEGQYSLTQLGRSLNREARLNYLEDMAAFLLEQDQPTQNSYQRGLRLILRILQTPERDIDEKVYNLGDHTQLIETENGLTGRCMLPTSSREFAVLLRQLEQPVLKQTTRK